MDQRGAAARSTGRALAGEEQDEVAATEARAQYRAAGIPPVATDARIESLLRPGERIFAVHRPARAWRRTSPEGPTAPVEIAGDLYLTSARLVVLGETILDEDIEDIEEAVLAGDQLLLVMRRGVGLALDVERPRLLRVQIAAARAVARGPGAGPPGRTPR
jgi:hypothetical protein